MSTRQPFEAVVAEHGATVLRVCRAVLGAAGAGDADDAWSETFLSALRAYPDLPADANVQAWLVTIAHRRAIDVWRARSRAPVPVAEIPDRTAGTVVADSGLDLGPDLDLGARLAVLPDRQRHAVVYHYLGGLPYLDVAAIIGGTAGAARRAASDGIAALRRTQPGGTPPATGSARTRRPSPTAPRRAPR